MVTVTSTTPAEALGSTAVIEVALLTVKLVAVVVPNFTALELLRLVPVIATVVPPANGPAVGLTPVTVGAKVYVK